MKFNYVARTSSGEVQSGSLESRTREQAIEALQRAGLIIISLKSKITMPFLAREIRFLQGVKSKDLVIFFRQLAILFSAKVSLVEGLRIVAKQTENKYFQEIILKISEEVEAGIILSRAMEKYPKIFSPFYINMIKSGEVSGALENILNYLADYVEKQFYLNSRIKGAFTYPAFVFFGFIIVAVLMLVMIMPHLTSILKESGQSLPWATQAIITVSDGLRNFGWLILLIIGALVGGFFYYLRVYPQGQKQIDMLKLKLPIFGEIFQKFYLARITDTLGTLIAGGIPILQALQIAADIVGNEVLKAILSEARNEVRIGNPMSVVFEKYKYIPIMVTQMVAIGEQTGTIDEVMKKIATFYTREVDNTVNTLSQLIEPVLIVFLGLGVGFLVSAILMPIYNLAGSF